MAKKPSAMKDFLILLGAFAALLVGLYAYTQVWPPAVIVESGSMMHRDSEVGYGRIGTIDPGDLVLVKGVDGREDVTTWAEGGRTRYGMPGDVVVYYPRNFREATPIIHRAIAWIDVERVNGEVQYSVQWNPDAPCPPQARRGTDATCVFGSEGVTIQEVNLHNYRPFRSGLVTKGDNPVTNPRADQMSGLSDIVQPEWIQGKSRGEVPWLGLIKLSLSPQFNEPNCVTNGRNFKFFEESGICRGWVAFGRAYAPKDLWVMLGVALFVLVGLPLIYDVYRAYADRKKAAAAGAFPPTAPASEPGEISTQTGPLGVHRDAPPGPSGEKDEGPRDGPAPPPPPPS